MSTLKRKIRLTVGDPSAPILFTDSLRVDFHVEQIIGDALNTGRFTIYNLAPDTIKALSKAKTAPVLLEVGSVTDKELSVLFQGELTSMHTTPMFEHTLTTLWCWERGVKVGKDIYPFISPYTNVPLHTILASLVGSIKDSKGNQLFALDTSAVTGGKLDKIIPSYSTILPPLNAVYELIRQNMTYTIQNGVVHISDRPLKKGDEDVMAESGRFERFYINPLLLKKPIDFGIATVDVYYELTPEVRPLNILSITDPELQTSLSGYSDKALRLVEDLNKIVPNENYFISKVTHVGSLYDNSWDTIIRGVIKDGNSNR